MPSPERAPSESEYVSQERPPQQAPSVPQAERIPGGAADFRRVQDLLAEVEKLRREEANAKNELPNAVQGESIFSQAELYARLDRIPDEIAEREGVMYKLAAERDDDFGRDLRELTDARNAIREARFDISQIEGQIDTFERDGDKHTVELLKKLLDERKATAAAAGDRETALSHKYERAVPEAAAASEDGDRLEKSKDVEYGILAHEPTPREEAAGIRRIVNPAEAKAIRDLNQKVTHARLTLKRRLRSEGKIKKDTTLEFTEGNVFEVGANGRRALTSPDEPDVVAYADAIREDIAFEAQLKERYAEQLVDALQKRRKEVVVVDELRKIGKENKKKTKQAQQRVDRLDPAALEKTVVAQPPKAFETTNNIIQPSVEVPADIERKAATPEEAFKDGERLLDKIFSVTADVDSYARLPKARAEIGKTVPEDFDVQLRQRLDAVEDARVEMEAYVARQDADVAVDLRESLRILDGIRAASIEFGTLTEKLFFEKPTSDERAVINQKQLEAQRSLSQLSTQREQIRGRYATRGGKGDIAAAA